MNMHAVMCWCRRMFVCIRPVARPLAYMYIDTDVYICGRYIHTYIHAYVHTDAQPTRLNASGVQASVDGVGSNASQESADTPARSQADSHILLRGIMEALDARALAERRGTLCSAAAPSNDIWSVRIYFGLDVVHGLWLEGGASALFALIRHPLSAADPGRQAARRVVHNDNDTQPMSFGEPNLTAASGTPPTPAPEFADSIQWHTLVKSLQNLSLDLHCPKLGPK